MKKTILISFLLGSVISFAQDNNYQRVKAELVEWDAVRGEWLAESFNAMANDQPIPDRTFPEDLTPAEMYALVPTDRQERIRTIVQQPSTTQNRTPETTQSGTTRVPVGTTPSTGRTPGNGNRYITYVSRPGCPLTMGRTYGDPHIRTFDGKSYSFQTAGEYVLSSSPDRMFEVQARQRPQTNEVSLNTAVAMNVYGDRVGIYASEGPDGQAGTPVRVNGRAVYVNNETFYLPRGGTIQNTGNEYVVTWPTGEKVQAKLSSTSGMRFMNISVYVYECNGNYFGLMGNANGRSDDDFSGAGSRANLASSTIFDPFGSRDFGRSTSAMEREHLAFLARDFGNQFLVNDQTSLFDYGFGQSSWTFYDPSFPRTHLTLGDLTQADRDRARRECERQGILADDMSGCVMDLAHANIQPNPRPSTPNRTTGRDLNPVSDRKPNVNRTDVYERAPSSGITGERTPSTTGSGGRVTGGEQGSTLDHEAKPVEGKKPVTTDEERTFERVPSGERTGSEPVNPVRGESTSSEREKPIVTDRETVRKPVGGSTVTAEEKQPVISTPTPTPVNRPTPVTPATAKPERSSGTTTTRPSGSSTGSTTTRPTTTTPVERKPTPAPATTTPSKTTTVTPGSIKTTGTTKSGGAGTVTAPSPGRR